jgi:uncharacterized sodium:solute symporter family permease YidK
MATKSHHQTIQEYLIEMDEQVDVRKWKAIKTVGIAIVFLGIYYIGVLHGADPTGPFFWAILTGIMLAAGVELSELEMLAKLKDATINVDFDVTDNGDD